MDIFTEVILAVLLLTDLSLAVSSRLLHCIRLAALQGLLIGILPPVMHWNYGNPQMQVLILAAVTLLLKSLLLPSMLRRAMYRAKVRRELEPLAGYTLSLVIVLAAAAGFFLLCRRLTLPAGVRPLAIPAALTTMFTGLFLIMSRRKAITQAIGFLIFENGITVFGIGMMLEYGIIVELGILLDVFVLVFIAGIALFHINREFSHIDADRLHYLNDNRQNGGEQ